MKKIGLLVIVGVGVWLTACQNMLEEVPMDFVSRNNYYRNEADAQGALNGAYSSVGKEFYGIDNFILSELHSDLVLGRGSQAPISNMDQLLDQQNIGRTANHWFRLYESINRANAVLANVPSITDISESASTRILAEAHFLRALAYFELVRGWGAVPIKTSESTDLSDLESPRRPENEVYDLIIADAEAAEIGLLPAVGQETGQASQSAAKMLLAHVYLTIGDWQAAAAKAEEVITNGQYTLVAVQEPDDFYDIFASNTSSEDIMSVHHSDVSQSEITNFLHMGNNLPYNYSSTGFFAWLPNANSMIGEEWDDDDLRKPFNLYTEIQNAAGQWVPLPATTPVLFKKFITDNSGLRTYSVPVYRYAETLLFYAEAACRAENGPSALALERLNMIRRRAYGYNPDVASPVDYPSGMQEDDFIDAIMQERAYEFLIERRRWWDLKRIGKAKEAFAAIGKTLIDERLLYPIPENEINNNPAIGQENQNPGY
ncbi:RagB/SusD family nutrient uptake outer membrane protein [Sphingobacterium pedocola]|uniref:RagB/SusD family nutrient uptake outer membrane protein n=1 Tax=Sphingobacterium pedocola TaxID=2082722 RepID=A0ABR9TCW9_9SPHI|nr:RagB/SusD family nutrient uptake outer membrane protein [Sphingobacterium pedocola]MBE8723195.1 RagB/SusD family nutrient uptake outer membrane protein [Sphingobacterium pedocola]